MGDAGVGAADLLEHLRVGHRQALDVRLVDDGVVVLVAQRPVVAPVEVGVDDDREHRLAEVVLGVALGRVGEVVGEQRLVVGDLTLDGLGVGSRSSLLGSQLGGRWRVERAEDPEPVELTG